MKQKQLALLLSVTFLTLIKAELLTLEPPVTHTKSCIAAISAKAAKVYKVKSVTIAEVSAQVRFADINDIPEIILPIATVRSGTTAMLRVFGYANIPSHYQEIKAILRWQTLGEKAPQDWVIPKGGIVLDKETLGVRTEDESVYNPVAVIQNAYIRQMRETGSTLSQSELLKKINSKIKLVVMGRNPLDTWSSAKKGFAGTLSDDALLKNLIAAQKNVDDVAQEAEDSGIQVTYWLYESVQSPERSLQALFNKIGVHQKAMHSGWTALPQVGNPQSNVFLPPEPPVFDIEGILDRALYGTNSYQYIRGKRDNITDKERNLLMHEAMPIFLSWHLRSESDLGMSIPLH